MFTNTNSAVPRLLRTETLPGEEALIITHCEGREALSELFSYHVSFRSPIYLGRRSSYLAQPLSFRIQRNETDKPAFIHGMIDSLILIDKYRDKDFEYCAILRPWFALLTKTILHHVYYQKSITDILVEIMSKYSQLNDAFDISHIKKTHPKRDIWVQYNETDFDFLSRLLAEAGIHYYFEHDADDHKIFFSDDRWSYSTHDTELTYHGGLAQETPIKNWSPEDKLIHTDTEQVDYNPEQPQAALHSEHTPNPLPTDYPRYMQQSKHTTVPSGYHDQAESDEVAKRNSARLNQSRHSAEGITDCTTLRPGCMFTQRDLMYPDNARDYVITAIDQRMQDLSQLPTEPADEAEAKSRQRYEIATDSGTENIPEDEDTRESAAENIANSTKACDQAGNPITFYDNFLNAIDSEELFLPDIPDTAPRIHGLELCTVIGTSPGEIYTDKLARVKVKRYWEKQTPNLDDAPWIRVLQHNAGAGWGNLYIPRVGDTVYQGFEDGIPERGIVFGSLYHESNPPPFSLPEQSTISGIKSRSVGKDATHYNEISFDDKPGQEKVRIQAEKDFQEHIEGDSHTMVGNSSKTVIEKGDLNIKSNQGSFKLKAAEGLNLRAGATQLYMDNTGIYLQSPRIDLNPGAVSEVEDKVMPPVPPLKSSDVALTSGEAELADSSESKAAKTEKAAATKEKKEEWKLVPAEGGYPILIFETTRRKFNHNLPEPNPVAEDLRHGDESKATIESYGLGQPFKQKQISFSFGGDKMEVEGEDLFNLPAAVHFERMRKLKKPFSLFGETQDIFDEMVDKFESNTGGTYSNPLLTEKLKYHEITLEFNKSLSDFITSYAQSHDYINLETKKLASSYMSHSKTGAKLPKFDKWSFDSFDGTVLTVHDIYAMEVYLIKLERKGNQIRGQLSYKIQDHFGLDKNDINHTSEDSLLKRYESWQGFVSWYLLQHYVGYNYKPFTTEIDFVLEIAS